MNLGLVGVLVHLLGDAANSRFSPLSYEEPHSLNCYPKDVGVVIVAVLLWKLECPKRFYADPAMSLAISLVIFGSALPLSTHTRDPFFTSPCQLN